jgi:tRNA(Ile)-lysidine synthase
VAANVRYDYPVNEEVATAQRRIVRSWRSLTGGPAVRDAHRPTLLAVSGGADSCALALALAGRTGVQCIGHVVHDMRPRDEAEADRHMVEKLGLKLGLAVRVEHIEVGPGNAEGNARRLRYAALAKMAADARCTYVAAAHHADDVLETMLANLIRGAGPRGLRGPEPRRRLDENTTLVRPMLHVTRKEAEAICETAGWQWSHDATNDDPGGQDAPLRAAIRARVLPVLEGLRPGASIRASRAAEAVGQAVRVVEAAVDAALPAFAMVEGDGVRLDTGVLVECPPAVREGLLRRVLGHVGEAGHDRLSAATTRSLLGWMLEGRGTREVAGLRFEHAGSSVLVSQA